MTSQISLLTGVALLASVALASGAQAQYPAYPYSQVPIMPQPVSNYDPYTQGLSPCPQWHAGDTLRCGEQMPPDFGQPGYRPTR